MEASMLRGLNRPLLASSTAKRPLAVRAAPPGGHSEIVRALAVDRVSSPVDNKLVTRQQSGEPSSSSSASPPSQLRGASASPAGGPVGTSSSSSSGGGGSGNNSGSSNGGPAGNTRRRVPVQAASEKANKKQPRPRSAPQEGGGAPPGRGPGGGAAAAAGPPRPNTRSRNILNQLIRSSESVGDLAAVFEEHGDSFEHQNVANSLYTMAKLVPAQGRLRPEWLRPSQVRPAGYTNYRRQQEQAAYEEDSDEGLDNYFRTGPMGHDHEDYHPPAPVDRTPPEATMFAALLNKAEDLLEDMSPMDYSLVAWSVGSLGVRNREHLVEGICRRAASQSGALKPQDVANLVLTCGRLQHGDPLFLGAMADTAAGMARMFKPQEIANITWGFAKIGFDPGPYFLGRIVQEVESRSGAFKTKELIMVLWAFAAIQYRSDALLTCFAAEAVKPERVQSMGPQCIANTLWAYSRFRSGPSDPLTQTLVARAQVMLPSFKPLELGQLMYAAAQLDSMDTQLANAVASDARRRIRKFRQQELVLLVWSVGRVKHRHDELAKLVADEAARRFQSEARPFKPQAVANLMKSYARLGFVPSTLLPHVSQFARRSLPTFQPSEMSNLLYAFAKLKIEDPQLVSGIVSDVARRRREGRPFPDTYLKSIISSAEMLGAYPRALYEFLPVPGAAPTWGMGAPKQDEWMGFGEEDEYM